VLLSTYLDSARAVRRAHLDTARGVKVGGEVATGEGSRKRSAASSTQWRRMMRRRTRISVGY